MIMLSKIKAIAGLLLMAAALAVGGTNLAYRGQADEPTGQKDDHPGRIDQKREGREQVTGDDPGPTKAELSPNKQRRQKDYADALMSILKDARDKTPEQLDEMIQAKEKALEELRWSVYVAEGQVATLKKYRDASLTGETLRRNPSAVRQ